MLTFAHENGNKNCYKANKAVFNFVFPPFIFLLSR